MAYMYSIKAIDLVIWPVFEYLGIYLGVHVYSSCVHDIWGAALAEVKMLHYCSFMIIHVHVCGLCRIDECAFCKMV